MAVAGFVQVEAVRAGTTVQACSAEVRPIEGGAKPRLPTEVERKATACSQRYSRGTVAVRSVGLARARANLTTAQAELEIRLDSAMIEEVHASEQAEEVTVRARLAQARRRRRAKRKAQDVEGAAEGEVGRRAPQGTSPDTWAC